MNNRKASVVACDVSRRWQDVEEQSPKNAEKETTIIIIHSSSA